MFKDKHSHHLTPHTTDKTHQPHVDCDNIETIDPCPYSILRPIGEATCVPELVQPDGVKSRECLKGNGTL